MFFFTHLGCTFHAVKSKLINSFPKNLILVKGMMFLFRLRLLTPSENEQPGLVNLKREHGENTAFCLHLTHPFKFIFIWRCTWTDVLYCQIFVFFSLAPVPFVEWSAPRRLDTGNEEIYRFMIDFFCEKFSRTFFSNKNITSKSTYRYCAESGSALLARHKEGKAVSHCGGGFRRKYR